MFTPWNMALVRFSLLLFISCFWIHRTSSQATEACTQKINSCACQTKGGFINLEKLDQAKATGQPKWTGKPDITYPETTYSYNPCTSYTEGACASVAACQTQYSVQYPIAKQESATFKTDSTLGTILEYTSDGRTTKVQLVCDSSQEGTLDNTGEDLNNPGTYNMKLTTKYACSDLAPPPPGYSGGSGGLSPGSIMLIILFVCITVYLVGGVLFNKFYKGANGKEVLPNVDFWIMLPGLARDGVLFLWNKVRGVGGKGSTYNDI